MPVAEKNTHWLAEYENYLHLKICGELLTYLSREAAGELDGSEREHLEYLKGLSDRLHAAEEAAA